MNGIELQKVYIDSYINGYNMRKERISGQERNILRYPRLDTILMVEKHIKKCDGEFMKKKLWESLPKKMMYQTYCVIIYYLLQSRKISIDSEGKIGWMWYPEIARKYQAGADLGRNR